MSDHDSAAHNPRHEDDNLDGTIAQQPDLAPHSWVKRIVMAIVIVGVVYIAYLMSAAFFPRWWARQVKDLGGGNMTPSVLWGAFFGFLFTFIPLMLAFQIRRKALNWKFKIATLVVALLIAAPNLLTLAIVLGNSNAAHDASRVLSDNAPGFRWATLLAAIAGAAAAVFVAGSGITRRRRKAEVERLKGERDELKRSRDEPPAT